MFGQKMNKYYLIVDNSTQWTTWIIKTDEDFNTIEEYPLDNFTSPLIVDICQRDLSFTNKYIRCDYYYGWSISPKEFARLKRIYELYPMYKEYLKLIDYP